MVPLVKNIVIGSRAFELTHYLIEDRMHLTFSIIWAWKGKTCYHNYHSICTIIWDNGKLQMKANLTYIFQLKL